jgi:hypothetical protein
VLAAGYGKEGVLLMCVIMVVDGLPIICNILNVRNMHFLCQRCRYLSAEQKILEALSFGSVYHWHRGQTIDRY